MSDETYASAGRLMPTSYVNLGLQALRMHDHLLRHLIEQRKLPEEGWSEQTIEYVLQQFSAMDSNNFLENAGVGEREGRIYSRLVASRNHRLIHGIGRSGAILDHQPKAAGSTLMNVLANGLVLDAIRLSGIQSTSACFIVPMATGMTLTLCLLAFRLQRPNAEYVIWPRIDQKSCIKSSITAGFKLIVVNPILVGEELQTNVEEIERQVTTLGADKIAAVMTTTSCFAPRAPDKLEEVADLCKRHAIPHLINNAYGLQSSKCCHLIQQAIRCGRVDVFVQSTDKNFMVPVGGAIVAGPDEKLIQFISQTYPGRGSSSPSLDLFITLLSMGKQGYQKLLADRKDKFKILKTKLEQCAVSFGLKVIETPGNHISIAMSLPDNLEAKQLTELGSMLYTRFVSGARVVVKNDVKEISGNRFVGFGSHYDTYPFHYMTAAAAIGTQSDDIDKFITRLSKVLKKQLTQ